METLKQVTSLTRIVSNQKMSMLEIEQDVLLGQYTTLHIGGKAQYFTVAKAESDVSEIVTHAKSNSLPVTILGGGSNVLISDEGIAGLVVKNEIDGIEWSEEDGAVSVRAGSGVSFDLLVKDSVERGYWGMENLSLIPGSVGATPIQNVGAYGVEVKDLIKSVEAVSLVTGKTRVFSNQECQFGYRDSFFKTKEGRLFFVTAVTFLLQTDAEPRITYKDLAVHFAGQNNITVTEVRDAVVGIRSGKFPDWNDIGTAGSFFKNPIIEAGQAKLLEEKYPGIPMFGTPSGDVKVSLSWLLDKVLNLKGVQHGDVGLYEKHVLVLVNHGSATAMAVDKFADFVSEAVEKEVGVRPEREVTKLGK